MTLPFLAPSVRLRQWLVQVWQTPLGSHYRDFSHRYLAYVMVPILICMLTYLSMRYMGVSHFPGYYQSHLLYHHRYALETALNFGFWLYLTEEWGSRLLAAWVAAWVGTWFHRNNRTVGAICLFWIVGFGVAFCLQLTLIYERIDLYAPKIMHFYDVYPLRRPSISLRLVIFGSIWVITLGCRIAYHLLIQRFIEGRQQPPAMKSARQRPDTQVQHVAAAKCPSETDEKTPKERKPLYISNGNVVDAVEPDTLAHISSEGHYCRFIMRAEDKPKEIFTRVALRDIVAELPPDDFIQIHRSHVVNKRYIERLKRSGRSYALYLHGADKPLPISRYRWPAIRDRIEPSGC